jgi:putative membrane protein
MDTSTRTTIDAALRERPSPPLFLLIVFFLLWLWLALAPVSREDWLLENLLVFAAVPALVATHRALQFSHGAYICLFAFFALHTIGAHYTYSLVPYDRWWEGLTGASLSEVFGLERNHYDRAIHFLYGALILPAAVELFEAYAKPHGLWRAVLPAMFVMSHSVIYEVIEWLAASIVAPELGDAYVGAQGDHWDAQKDMALAAAGALCMTALFRVDAFGRLFRSTAPCAAGVAGQCERA